MSNISLHKCYLIFLFSLFYLGMSRLFSIMIRAAWLSKYPCDRKKFVLDKCLIFKISLRAYLD